MRPCNPVSLFPVKSSSKTPPAPSKAPSRMSLSLLLLRLLRAGQRKTYEESVTLIRIHNIPNLIAVINHVCSTNKCYLSYFHLNVRVSYTILITAYSHHYNSQGAHTHTQTNKIKWDEWSQTTKNDYYLSFLQTQWEKLKWKESIWPQRQ